MDRGSNWYLRCGTCVSSRAKPRKPRFKHRHPSRYNRDMGDKPKKLTWTSIGWMAIGPLVLGYLLSGGPAARFAPDRRAADLRTARASL